MRNKYLNTLRDSLFNSVIPFSCGKVFLFYGEDMKTLIKNNILFILGGFNLFLSVIGISTAMEAVKNEQYDNPFLYSFPVSIALWMLFGLFPAPQKKDDDSEEIEAGNECYSWSPFINLPHRQRIIIRAILTKIIDIIAMICALIILTDFTMLFFIIVKFAAIPFSP